ncbi:MULTISPECIES: Fur family transcriptional regulator [Deferrisoma]
MTARTSSVDPELERLREAFQRHGLRLTHQRIELYRAVVSDPSHPTVEAVFRRARTKLPTVSLDTVYRALSLFEKLGLITRVDPTGSGVRYDPDPTPHHHLVCRRCQTILDFRWPEADELEPPIPASTWGVVEGRRVEIWGLCKACAAAGQEKG